MNKVTSMIKNYALSLQSRRHKYPAFIHIPKTGGTYLSGYERGYDSPIKPIKYLGHINVVESKNEPSILTTDLDPRYKYRTVLRSDLKNNYILSVVRNVYTFLVSYAGHAGGWNPKYRDQNHYDYQNAQRGFEYLLETIVNRESPWPSRKFIFNQLFSTNSDLVVDWIGHSETLDNDLEMLAEKNKLSFSKQKPARQGNIRDYRTYYSDHLIELVSETFSRELNLFGYNHKDFNSYDSEKAVLCGEVNRNLKRSIRYYWEKDQLEINDKIFLC